MRIVFSVSTNFSSMFQKIIITSKCSKFVIEALFPASLFLWSSYVSISCIRQSTSDDSLVLECQQIGLCPYISIFNIPILFGFNTFSPRLIHESLIFERFMSLIMPVELKFYIDPLVFGQADQYRDARFSIRSDNSWKAINLFKLKN